MHDFPRLARGLLQFLLIVRGVVAGVAAVVPFDLQILSPFEGGESIVGNHRHATQRLKRMRRLERIDRDRLLDSNHLQRRGVVDGLNFPSQHGRMRDGRIEHAVYANVHSEQRLARTDVSNVVSWRRLADVAPLLRRLQFQLFFLRHRLLGRESSKFSVANLARRLRIGHGMHRVGHALRLRHSPLLRRRAHQHQPRRSSSLPQHIKKLADGVRPVGILRSETGVAIRLNDFHAVPIGVEFVSENPRQTRPHAVPHFRPVRHDVNGSVGMNADEDARMKRSRINGCWRRRTRRPQRFWNDPCTQHKRSRREHALKKTTPADIFDRDRAR